MVTSCLAWNPLLFSDILRPSLPLSHSPCVASPSLPLPYIHPEHLAVQWTEVLSAHWAFSQWPQGLLFSLPKMWFSSLLLISSNQPMSCPQGSFPCTPQFHPFLQCRGLPCVVTLANQILSRAGSMSVLLCPMFGTSFHTKQGAAKCFYFVCLLFNSFY